MSARTIPFFNYQALFKADEARLLEVMRDVCARGAYILQSDLLEFERAIAKYLEVSHAIGVADGTNALILGLRAMGIKEGDEVLVPSHTYVASAAAIHFTGAIPVLVDCGPDHLLDIESVESAISQRTKAIMPVHLNGRTCDMDQVLDLSKRYNLQIIEDAAQALGARYKGRYAGTFGAVGSFSFYPAKVLGCFGDGGMLVTNDHNTAAKLRELRDHGRNPQGQVCSWGTNCRLDNLQAAILNFKLKSFDQAIQRRREIANRYQMGLSEISDLTLPPAPETILRYDVFQNYEIESGQRDKLKAFLLERGISSLIQWGGKALHQIEALGLTSFNLPRTENLFKRCLMLPMNTTLSDQDVDYIIKTIQDFYAQ